MFSSAARDTGIIDQHVRGRLRTAESAESSLGEVPE